MDRSGHVREGQGIEFSHPADLVVSMSTIGLLVRFHNRRHGQLDHPYADRHSGPVLYLEASDYKLRLSDRHNFRQIHIVLIGDFLVSCPARGTTRRIKGRRKEPWIEEGTPIL